MGCLSSAISAGHFFEEQVAIIPNTLTAHAAEQLPTNELSVGFDLLFDLDEAFSGVKAVVGLLDFQITSPEIQPDKYEFLLSNRERCLILGEQLIKLFGLGIADLCEAFIAYKK